MTDETANYPPVPADDLGRTLSLVDPESNELAHIGLVGDTYTVTVRGQDTAGKYCVIDMHVPPGGGPPPHRHDFEETFIVLEGEIEAIFRGAKPQVHAGQTIHIPANAPHQFHNAGSVPARLICICATAGQEEFFAEVGVPVATRTTPPPQPGVEEQAALMRKALALAPKHRTEFLKEA